MRHFQNLLSTPGRSQILLATLTLALALPTPARAAIVISGNVDPADPATWNDSRYTRVYIGKTALGTLTVDGGSGVRSNYNSYLGYESGSEGTATISGSHSGWYTNYSLYVGSEGTGTLNILDGGWVTCRFFGFLGYESGSEGTATVSGGSRWTMDWNLHVGSEGTGTLNILDGGRVSVAEETHVNRYDTGSKVVFDGGVLTTEHIFASADDLQGVGTITANGWILDADVTINTSTFGYSFAIVDPTAGKNISFQIGRAGTDPGDVGAGYRGTGSLRINSGGLVKSRYGYLGYESGSEGTATVSGSGSTWEMRYQLYVGNSGTGTLNINDGGLVKSSGAGFLGYESGSEGTATVSGSGSTWYMMRSGLLIGHSGTGTLNIQNGGRVTNSSSGYLGYESGSEGTATVSGSGSTWDSGGLNVGDSGTGTLNIYDGGLVKSRSYGYLGHYSGSDGTATVSGNGSTWEVSQWLYVGNSGTGTLNILDGGLVENGTGRIGWRSGSEGTATVSGSGSTWDLSWSLSVGSSGTGTLNIQDDGLVECSNHGYLGYESGSEGTATVSGSGSTWEIGEILYVGYDGTGTLNVHDGGLVKSSDGSLGYHYYSEGTATVSGSGSTWEIDVGSGLLIGRYGTGTLNIHDGGLVKSYRGNLGDYARSEGTATVSGSASIWNMDRDLSVGRYGTGTLNIQDGGLVRCSYGSLGSGSGSEGMATVNGSGSTWEMSSSLSVGGSGTGTLNIQDGGLVSAGGNTYVGRYDTGSKIVFDGGTLETRSIYTSTDDLQGVGTIKTAGWVLDNADVTINTSTLVHSFAITDPASGKNIIFQIDQTGTDLGTVGAGWRGTGSLTINSGGLVKSRDGVLGYESGSEGTATVSGTGSTWEMSNWLEVGRLGIGTLNIYDGGLVKCDGNGSLAYRAGPPIFSGQGYLGTATVNGTGSTWEMGSSLIVGGQYSGTGTLNIHDGGLVSVGNDASVNSTGTLAFGIGSSGSGLLDAGGNVTFDGAFGVTLLDGYMPDVGNSFTLIQADGPDGITGLSHGGMMAQLPAIDWWLFWESDYAEGSSELTLAVDSEYTPFPLDIRPGSDENRLNLKSKGVLPVSILTSDEFDALGVNLETLLFGDPLLVDKTTTPLPPIRINETDVNDDGLMDLTLFFSIPDLLDAGMLGPSSEEALMFGMLFDGTEIVSSDMLSIVPKPKGKFLGPIDEAEALAMGRSASISPIPEPGTLALLCMGIFGFLVHVRRRR